MPRRPARYCARPWCSNPAHRRGLCHAHLREAEAQRPDSHAIYRTTRWRKLRALVLSLEPNCRVCGAPASHVDHIRPIEEGGDPWDVNNLQPLCPTHHSEKTARENRFGGRHD